MNILGIVKEDFLQYKKPSMFIIFPKCTMKCEKDCGEKCCQNRSLLNQPLITISKEIIINDYLKDTITKAVVFGGMEPLDSFSEIIEFIDAFRKVCNDDIVIYSGYYESEIQQKITELKKYQNIILKVGRYIPHSSPVQDPLLGITLASNNQYAIRL